MDSNEVLAWLHAVSSEAERHSMTRYGIPNDRALVDKAADMALRAVARRNALLWRLTSETAERMAGSQDKGRAWVGHHTLRELAKKAPATESS